MELTRFYGMSCNPLNNSNLSIRLEVALTGLFVKICVASKHIEDCAYVQFSEPNDYSANAHAIMRSIGEKTDDMIHLASKDKAVWS